MRARTLSLLVVLLVSASSAAQGVVTATTTCTCTCPAGPSLESAAAVQSGSPPDAPDVTPVLAPAPLTPDLDHPWTSLRAFVIAVKSGAWWLAAMFLLVIVVGGLRIGGKRLHAAIPDDTTHPVLRPIEKFLFFTFDTKVGGWLLNWLTTVAGCLLTSYSAGLVVDAAAWKAAALISTSSTALVELADDVQEWWKLRKAKQVTGASGAFAPTSVELVPATPGEPPPATTSVTEVP